MVTPPSPLPPCRTLPLPVSIVGSVGHELSVLGQTL